MTPGTYHHFTFHTDANIPEGFQMVTVINEDVQTTPVTSADNTYTFDVFSDYSFLSLQLAAETASKIHFDRITREVKEIDPTAIGFIENTDTDAAVVATQVFSPEGIAISQLSKGINIVRERLANGQVRTRKLIIR